MKLVIEVVFKDDTSINSNPAQAVLGRGGLPTRGLPGKRLAVTALIVRAIVPQNAAMRSAVDLKEMGASQVMNVTAAAPTACDLAHQMDSRLHRRHLANPKGKVSLRAEWSTRAFAGKVAKSGGNRASVLGISIRRAGLGKHRELREPHQRRNRSSSPIDL